MTLSGYSSTTNIFSQKGSHMRVGVMMGSRYGKSVPEKAKAGRVEKAKEKLVKKPSAPRKKRVKKSDG